MTSPERAVAEAWRLQYQIRRTPAGWSSPVNVQEWAPNAPGYSYAVAGRVDHCGLSINTILHNIGLRVGTHYGNQAWTPSGFSWFRSNSRAVDLGSVRKGDIVYFSNSGSINDITHVEIATEDARADGGVPCLGWNTDISGTGIWRVRYRNYMVAAGRPVYSAVIIPAEQPKPDPFAPTGAIGARWVKIGGAKSVIGKPVSAEADFLPSVRVQRFERGIILHAAHTGAWELYGAIAQFWASGGASEVGLPLGPETDMPHVPGGRWQRFVRGHIAWHPDHGTHSIKGAILMSYLAADAATRTKFGPLTSNELDAKVSLFKSGRIAWQPEQGTWAS
jgi:hypothetical protein